MSNILGLFWNNGDKNKQIRKYSAKIDDIYYTENEFGFYESFDNYKPLNKKEIIKQKLKLIKDSLFIAKKGFDKRDLFLFEEISNLLDCLGEIGFERKEAIKIGDRFWVNGKRCTVVLSLRDCLYGVHFDGVDYKYDEYDSISCFSLTNND